MANENQNTGPNTQGPDKGQTRQTVADLKEIKRGQGDFNDAIKESINLLKQLDRSYERIEARLQTMNKSSINIKEINQELSKARQKDYITSKQLSDAEKSTSQESKNRIDQYLKSQSKINELEARKLEYLRQGNKDKVSEVNLLLSEYTALNERQKSALDVQEAELIALREADKIAKAGIAIGEQKLKTEKELKSQIGFSGAALGLFAKKLGLGNKVYEDMVEKARTLQETGKKITFLDKLGTLGKAAGASMKEAITDPLLAIPLAGAAIGGLVKGLMAVFNYILEIQDKTVKFARAMNLSTAEARKIKMEFASISVSSGDLFVTSQKMVESQMEFVDALGVTNRLSNEQLATNIKLKDIAGLDLETRKGIVESSILTGRSSESITKSVLTQVAGLKQTTGISFQYQRILKEASNLGGYLGLSFSKYPAQLTKSLLTVKAMGMELKQLDQIADSFLDFESSISKEFEAQLLTGKDINLAKAREAFLNNDLATAASEITRQVGSAADFLKLNRIQAESLAGAFGMSRDQMGEMLKQQELLSKLGAKDLKDAQDKVQALKAQGKSKEEIIRLTGEEAYQSLINASAQEKIGAFMDKIKQSIADFVEKSGIIEKLEGFFDYLSKPENIKKIIEGVRDFFASAVEFIGKAAYYILEGLDYVAFGQIPDSFIDSIKEGSANMGAQIRSLGGDLGGVSVEGKKAEAQVKTDAATSFVEYKDNNKLASPTEVYLLVTVDPDNGVKVQKRISKDVYERQFGQMANQFKPA